MSAAVFIIPDGDVTALKSAINTSNTNGDDDTIELASNGDYLLLTGDNGGDTGLPTIAADGDKKLTIHGNGATIHRSIANGTPAFRIFHIVSGADVTISELTVSNGVSPFCCCGPYGGGGILSEHATLTLNNCTLSGNFAEYGGAIFNAGWVSGDATLIVANSYSYSLEDAEG